MKKVIKISDLHLITALAYYVPIVGVSKADGSRLEFHFADTKEALDIITCFWNDTLKVSPRQYGLLLKSIRIRIEEEKRRLRDA